MARWSPDGQYLAVIKSKGAKYPIHESYDLVVLDTATGRLFPTDSENVGYLEDIAWAPDNRHLAIIGRADFSDRLYLVDFLSGEAVSLFPSYEIISNYFGSGLAWSPDGSKLLATCPTEKEGRLCLISVQRAGQ